MHKLFLQINQVLKQISNPKIHLWFLNIDLVDLEWITTSMSLKAPGKEELSFIMEPTGEPFAMIQILTWLPPMFSADLSIQDSELLAGQVLDTCHITEAVIFLMESIYQFWWTMFHALEMKQALINAHIDLSATVIIMKTLLSLAQEHQITLLVETTDWPTHIMKPVEMAPP